MERQCRMKEFELEDVKKLVSSEVNAAPESTMDELHQEISVCFLHSRLLIFIFIFQAILVSTEDLDCLWIYLKTFCPCIFGSKFIAETAR